MKKGESVWVEFKVDAVGSGAEIGHRTYADFFLVRPNSRQAREGSRFYGWLGKTEVGVDGRAPLGEICACVRHEENGHYLVYCPHYDGDKK